VIDHGLATRQEVRHCRQSQLRKHNGTPSRLFSLTEILLSKGIVTQRQIQRLIQKQKQADIGLNIPGLKILQKLGSGAMATVFLARQLSLDRLVAIKVLPQRHTKYPEFVKRFYAEGRAAAKLNHPNIIGALDVSRAGDFHYFVMEYVDGKTVFEQLKKIHRYTEAESLKIVIQIARALDHAHTAGLIHRDVKPTNIMLTRKGVAKLADMGLARVVSDEQSARAEQGKAFGTPYYISPEQIRGQIDVDFRADIYSLGATLYHMVTGRVPFEAPNPAGVMRKHLTTELVPPDHLNPLLSTGIGEIIEICMAKNRDDRHNTTADLLADLEAVHCGEPPIHARKKFDLGFLAGIEPTEPQTLAASTTKSPVTQKHPRVLTQPIVWLAITGWAAALAMAILMLRT